MSQEFIENRLKEEVVFLEQHLRQNDAQIDLLTTANHFENVFHHAFALQSSDQTIVSPVRWQPLLISLLNDRQEKIIRVSGYAFDNRRSEERRVGKELR